MKFGAAILALFGASSSHAFAPSSVSRSSSAGVEASPSASTTALKIVPGDSADVLARINAILEEAAAPQVDASFDQIVQSYFPGAIPNGALVNAVVDILRTKGYTTANTLVATSLCCDELARRLEDDFVRIYGNNFALGGLAGFPFAGNTGFGAMAAHIPDNGYCLCVYGPHVGISKDGTVGKVERQGIALIDTCCGSAVAADRYLKGITDGGATMVADVQRFTDFQQGAVQQLILPHGKRLSDAENRMVELPLALFDSQDVLMQDIVQAGASGTKEGLALLGGIQINTSPDVPDYFLPIRFDYMNNKGEIIESLLPTLTDMVAVLLHRPKRKIKRLPMKRWKANVPLSQHVAPSKPVSRSKRKSKRRDKSASTTTAGQGFGTSQTSGQGFGTTQKSAKSPPSPPQKQGSAASEVPSSQPLSVPLLRQPVVGSRPPTTTTTAAAANIPAMTPQIAPAEPVPVRRLTPPPAPAPAPSPLADEIRRLLDVLPPKEASEVRRLVDSLPSSSSLLSDVRQQDVTSVSSSSSSSPAPPQPPTPPPSPPKRKKLADEIRRKLALEGDPQGVLSSGYGDPYNPASSMSSQPPPPPTSQLPPNFMSDELRRRVQFDPTEPSVQRRQQQQQRREPFVLRPDPGMRQDGRGQGKNRFTAPTSYVWDADTVFRDNEPQDLGRPPRPRRTKPSAPLSPDVIPGADRSQRQPGQPEPKSSLRPDEHLSARRQGDGPSFTQDLEGPRRKRPVQPVDNRINGEDNYIDALQEYIEALQDYIDSTFEPNEQGPQSRVVPLFDPASTTWNTQKPQDAIDLTGRSSQNTRYPPPPPPPPPPPSSLDPYGDFRSQSPNQAAYTGTSRGAYNSPPPTSSPSKWSSPSELPTLEELEEDFLAMSADFLPSSGYDSYGKLDDGYFNQKAMKNANPESDKNSMVPVDGETPKKDALPPPKKPVDEFAGNPIAKAVAGGRIL